MQDASVQPIDMSGVDPRRWEEVKKRADVVRGYLASDKRSERQRKLAATKLRISPTQFMVLVKAWQIHQKAAVLAGSGRKGVTPRVRAGGIPATVKALIAEVIERLSCSSDARAVIEAVRTECTELGLEPPSNISINTQLMEARVAGAHHTYDGEPILVTARLWIGFAVKVDDSSLVRPEIVIGMSLPERRIESIVTGLQHDSPPTMKDLINDISSLPDAMMDDRPIMVSHAEAAALTDIAPETINRLLVKDQAGTMPSRYLGDRIGMLNLLFRRPKTEAAKLLSSRFDQPMNEDDACELIEAAIRKHNSTLRPASRARS